MIRKCHHFPMPINGHGSAVGMASVATNTFQRDDWTLNLKQTGVSVLMVIEEHSRALRIRREKKKKKGIILLSQDSRNWKQKGGWRAKENNPS